MKPNRFTNTQVKKLVALQEKYLQETYEQEIAIEIYRLFTKYEIPTTLDNKQLYVKFLMKQEHSSVDTFEESFNEFYKEWERANHNNTFNKKLEEWIE